MSFLFSGRRAPAIPDAAVEHLDNFWPMDDRSSTLVDKLNGRDLTFENGSWDGDVAMFDGSSTFAWEPNTDNHFTELDDFTLFGWAITHDNERNQVFAGSYDTDGGASWDAWISPENTSGDRKNNHSVDGDNFEATDLQTGPAPENEWFSFAFARTASDNEWRYYEDGDLLDVQDDYSSLTGTLNANDEEFWVGAIQFDGDRNWDGRLMDFGFNASSALSESQIQDLHNDTGPNA